MQLIPCENEYTGCIGLLSLPSLILADAVNLCENDHTGCIGLLSLPSLLLADAVKLV